ncbi:hypothetical protein EHQ58_12025 [Leptospira ognonensis]|uniref:Uncharacterized protein n=1 Tax=Leptospira ognonensis TaxID=2484945 RepID=A0A4R9K1W4_9LEPT|nr:hypothetical protein [Leptospira ognonensis]TGL58105.1 hypothetical protein EHQ58_12025 [Leptospira ognonensis]
MEQFPHPKRDFLDLFETYKYMNEPVFWDGMDLTGRVDHGQGWVQLNIPESEWQMRLVANLFQSFPNCADK